jgi:hypothetical protein
MENLSGNDKLSGNPICSFFSFDVDASLVSGIGGGVSNDASGKSSSKDKVLGVEVSGVLNISKSTPKVINRIQTSKVETTIIVEYILQLQGNNLTNF